jgi:dTDP-4-amino-4,6-dideoxygalactose transaminase
MTTDGQMTNRGHHSGRYEEQWRAALDTPGSRHFFRSRRYCGAVKYPRSWFAPFAGWNEKMEISMVPLLDLKKHHAPLAAEFRAAFERVLHSGQFILGREVEEFEQATAELTGARHAIGVSSGTDAILLALMALDIGPGDEVLCPSFTFFATAGCVARVGATPMFVDSCATSFNIDVADAARRITPRTKAIIPVHLYGQTADMRAVRELARVHGLWVIEDAAQALGATFDGKPAGSMGDFGTFSFFPTKNLGALGDAGLLVTNDDGLAARSHLLRNHGAEKQYFHDLIGGNFRLDSLQAAFLSVKLPHLAEYTARRRENAAYYTTALSKVRGVSLPREVPGNHHIWNQYTLRIGNDRRDELRRFLSERGVGSGVYYPVPLHLQECFAAQYVPRLPVAEQLARECLSLPIYPELTRDQLDLVVDAVSEFVIKSVR